MTYHRLGDTLSDMSTPLELGAVEAIKRGHRQARDLIVRYQAATTDDERLAIMGEFARLCDLLTALTGLTTIQIMDAATRRVTADGLVQL